MYFNKTFNEKLIRESGYSPASLNNILTWIQLSRTKKPHHVLPVAKEVYQDIKAVLKYPDYVVSEQLDGKWFSIYRVSDVKILYMILQHSLYSSLRGEGVRDRNHQCKIIPHN